MIKIWGTIQEIIVQPSKRHIFSNVSPRTASYSLFRKNFIYMLGRILSAVLTGKWQWILIELLANFCECYFCFAKDARTLINTTGRENVISPLTPHEKTRRSNSWLRIFCFYLLTYLLRNLLLLVTHSPNAKRILIFVCFFSFHLQVIDAFCSKLFLPCQYTVRIGCNIEYISV